MANATTTRIASSEVAQFRIWNAAEYFQVIGDLTQFSTLAGLSDSMAEAEGPLRLPPGSVFLGQAAASQLPHAGPFRGQQRRQHKFGTGIHAFEALESVMVEAQRRRQFLEEQLDPPAQRAQLNLVPQLEPRVVSISARQPLGYSVAAL